MRLIQTILLCLYITSSFLGYSQTKEENSLLWKISRKDMKSASYLFGTIHLICKEDYVWTKPMQAGLSDCKEICFELDLDDPNMMMEVAKGMISTDGKSLKDYFSDSDYVLLTKYVKDSLKMDISLFQQMKPVALETLFASSSPSCESPQSYENNIMQIAQKSNREITGLESVSEQLDLFDNLPADSVVKDIMSVIKGKQDDKSEYRKMVTAYKKQDLQQLYKLISESEQIDKELSSFLDVRNEKWIPRIIEKMDRTSVFFAVGAGHLPGKNGVIALLRKAGYTVTPVK
ncbi:MAG: TraB/GumN family protein [Bacteroidetes bacterium]|nr:TraB/GumN family protein [Bacteroidota bacterium]